MLKVGHTWVLNVHLPMNGPRSIRESCIQDRLARTALQRLAGHHQFQQSIMQR